VGGCRCASKMGQSDERSVVGTKAGSGYKNRAKMVDTLVGPRGLTRSSGECYVHVLDVEYGTMLMVTWGAGSDLVCASISTI
jgi:hypothetical protein